MKLVSYVPLVDEASQTFVARALTPVDSDPAESNAGIRPAVILSTAETDGAQFANLAVFTDFGDPFRGATPDAVIRIPRVPYSETKEPGTYHAAATPRAAK